MEGEKMKVAYCTKYGPPEVVELREFDKPFPKDDEVLIKIHATSLHRGDSRMRGLDIPGPFFMSIMARLFLGFRRVGNGVLGMEFAGTVEAVGKEVTKFKVGDEVWASTVWSKFGAHAEYKTMKENGVLTLKPVNLSFKEAAVIPSGGITTVGIIKMANIKPGHKMLIYGASGSVGSSAILLAKTLGAEVTAVCSGTNHDFVRSLGADEVVNYKTTDFTTLGETYDIIFDAVDLYKGDYKRVLKENGVYLNVDKSSNKIKKENVIGLLTELKELCESGKFKAIIDRTYSFDKIVEAYRYVDSSRKRGNVAITVTQE